MIDQAHEDFNSGEPDDPARNKNRLVRPAALVLGALLGTAVVLVAVLLYALLARDATPRLTAAAYEAAAERWDRHGPTSYNLELELTGNRPSRIRVEVRDGEVVRMTRDGVVPKQERTWYYWSVPGQFDTIAQELEMASDPAASFKSPAATQMVMWAEFDPEYGYPARYGRVVLGADFEIHWEVTKFEPLDDNR